MVEYKENTFSLDFNINCRISINMEIKNDCMYLSH